MKDELLKQLKDAGFQFKHYGTGFDSEFIPESRPLFPTLSELMEACNGKWGQRFRWLGNEKTYWSAQARPIHPRSKQYPDSPLESWKGNKDIKTKGSTPEEAVALLWLELNKK